MDGRCEGEIINERFGGRYRLEILSLEGRENEIGFVLWGLSLWWKK